MPEMVDPTQGEKDDELLKRIRHRYRYAHDKWRRNRDEGQKNMRYVSGDPWDDEDRMARKNRPTVCADQLNQYVNQVVNTARQNPRGVVVDPAGDGATDALAEYRENRIRAIEYGCNAQQAYINGLQAAVERNIGYWKVTRAYVSDDSEEQEILVLPVMNPDSILIDPDYKTPDASDIRWAFELDRIPLEEFEIEYPDAQKRSFSADDFGGDSSVWFDGKCIVVASYWEIRQTTRQDGKGKKKAEKRVRQYITNGVEILKEGPEQPGPYIPIVPVPGKEIWVEYGQGGAERVLLSLVTLARDPQKALAYVMSSMLENVGQLPKTSFVGYTGQFETDAEAWKTANTVFHPYLQVDPTVDEASGQILPLPQRQELTPDFQAYAVGVDICQRAVQAAMGLQGLPTQAQRANQKSGIALDKIQSEQAIGSYHLVDNYDRAIKLTGRIINHWLSITDADKTEKPVRLADGSHKLVTINSDMPIQDTEGHTYHFPIADDNGRYQVTISSGPSHESQREEGSEFADTLVQNLHALPLSPEQAQKILSMVVKLKQLGPMGDQIAEIISPQNAQNAQQMQQMMQNQQAMQQQFAEMQAKLQQLTLEKQAKIIDRQGQLEVEKLKASTALAVAEMTASKDTNEAIAERDIATYRLLHEAAHERGMTQVEHQHELAMAQQQAQNDRIAAAQQAISQPAGPAQG